MVRRGSHPWHSTERAGTTAPVPPGKPRHRCGNKPVRPGVGTAPAYRGEEKSFGAKVVLFLSSPLCFLTPRIAAPLPASPALRRSPLGGCQSQRLRLGPGSGQGPRSGLGPGLGSDSPHPPHPPLLLSVPQGRRCPRSPSLTRAGRGAAPRRAAGSGTRCGRCGAGGARCGAGGAGQQ